MPKGLIGLPEQLMALKKKFTRKNGDATTSSPAPTAVALEPATKE
jgi:hypothetical protein